MSRPHAARYALFKTAPLYRHGDDLPGETDRVIVRTADFAKRSPAIAAQLKAYLESPDREDILPYCPKAGIDLVTFGMPCEIRRVVPMISLALRIRFATLDAPCGAGAFKARQV